MDYDAIFTAYYSLFRADSDVPTSTDDEYTVGLRLANEAIKYWENYDGTLWNELYDTLQNSTQTVPALVKTITTGTTTYAAPTNFRKAGGFVRVKDALGNDAEVYPIIEPNEMQFQNKDSRYCFFTGDSANGYDLNLNPAPTSELNGLDIDYVYYKTATVFTTGTDVTEMKNPYFIVHRMLGNQFRASRNPYYQSAMSDAAYAIKTMQTDNNSGSWANTPTLTDNSGTSFGS